MRRINHQGQWNVMQSQTWQIKLLRGSADFLSVNLSNFSGNAVNYAVTEIAQWDSHMDEIFGVQAGVPSRRSLALGALDYVPMHDGLYTNQGTRGGVAALAAGSLTNGNPWYGSEANVTYQQIANGYLRLVAAPTFSTYNGPWTVGLWVYPTLVSALTPLYHEANAGSTHYMQVFLDTDRRIGFRMSNGGSSFSVKDAGGPQIPLNQWSLIFCTYSTPNFTYTYYPPSGSGAISTPVSVGVGGMTTFVDSNITLMGFVGSTNGWIGAPFTFNSAAYNGFTTAPLYIAAQSMIATEWSYSYNAQTPLDSGTMVAATGKFSATYGDGTTRPYPATVVVALTPNAGDAAGFYSITMEKHD